MTKDYFHRFPKKQVAIATIRQNPSH